MWSRRDQVQAYQFLRRRLVAAFTEGDPNSQERPGRRLVVSTATGAGVTVLALGVFGVLGIIQKSSPHDWASGARIIVERETGARSVIDGNGQLHPVMNYTSALLFLAKHAEVVQVSRADLASRQPGPTIGVAGAPDSLPPATNLVKQPWTVCSDSKLDDIGHQDPEISVRIGYDPPTGGSDLHGGNALVVRNTTDRKLYLITQGAQFPIADPSLLSLFGTTIPPSKSPQVGAGMLNTLPKGPSIKPIKVEGQDSPGRVIDGQRWPVGQVFSLSQPSTDVQYYVLQRDGLIRIGALGADLVMASTKQKQQTPVSTSAVHDNQSPPDDTPVDAGLPSDVPRVVSLSGKTMALCATWTDTRAQTPQQLVVLAATPGPRGLATAAGSSTPGRASAAAEVAIKSNYGALVLPCRDSCSIGLIPHLVTQYGIFALGSTKVQEIFGYGDVTPTPVKAAILDLLPQGPALGIDAVQSQAPQQTSPDGALGAEHRQPPIG